MAKSAICQDLSRADLLPLPGCDGYQITIKENTNRHLFRKVTAPNREELPLTDPGGLVLADFQGGKVGQGLGGGNQVLSDFLRRGESTQRLSGGDGKGPYLCSAKGREMGAHSKTSPQIPG